MFQFEWDDAKAAENVRKHGLSFEIASTVFYDPAILSVPDLAHGDEERWFSVGFAANGTMVSIVYLWAEVDSMLTKVRVISARRSTRAEVREYLESL